MRVFLASRRKDKELRDYKRKNWMPTKTMNLYYANEELDVAVFFGSNRKVLIGRLC